MLSHSTPTLFLPLIYTSFALSHAPHASPSGSSGGLIDPIDGECGYVCVSLSAHPEAFRILSRRDPLFQEPPEAMAL